PEVASEDLHAGAVLRRVGCRHHGECYLAGTGASHPGLVERSNVLIIPLDERQGWYRFHPLFQRLLQQRLQARISAEELATLHRRASAWYAGQGLIQEAIEHALVAGDAPGGAKLVEDRFFWAFEQEQWVQKER